jgi:hypothetical protein
MEFGPLRQARVEVVMVVMIVMVDLALFGSREIGPGRGSLFDCHGRRYRQSRHRGAEQRRVQYRGRFDGHYTGLLMPYASW